MSKESTDPQPKEQKEKLLKKVTKTSFCSVESHGKGQT